jgi:molecular chaperone GrpE
MSETVPSATDSEATLDERLAAIDARLGELNDRAAHREAVIDRLHGEKEELRRGERRALLEPVVADLIRMHDSLTAAAARADVEAQPAHAELLRSFADDVETMLDRCGIDTVTAEPGADHDVGEHRVVGVLLTDVRERHNTVAEVVGIGFRDRASGRVRRPLLARFHRFDEAGAGDAPAAG